VAALCAQAVAITMHI